MPAVVSAIIGLPKLKPFKPKHVNRHWRYVLFTDRPRPEVRPWEQVIVTGSDDPVRTAKRYKMLPWEFLPDEDFHLWIDGHCQLMCDPERVKHKEGVTVVRHWCRHQCIRTEGQRVVSRRKARAGDVQSQLDSYAEHPDRWGLWFGGFIGMWNKPDVRAFGALWYALTNRGTVRDQLSLPVALRESGVTFHDVPRRQRRSYFGIGNK